jgi:hypothetical protein
VLRRRITPSLVVACVAVFISLTSTAWAVTMITGAQVKDGSLSGKDLKDGTVGPKDVSGLTNKDFIPGAGAPKGDRGPEGPTGLSGPKGDAGSQGVQGVPGPAGPVTAIRRTRTGGSVSLLSLANLDTVVLTVTVPAGSHAVWVSGDISNFADAAFFRCRLVTADHPEPAAAIAATTAFIGNGNGNVQAMPIAATYTAAASTTLNVTCRSDTTITDGSPTPPYPHFENPSLVAFPVDSVDDVTYS